MKMENETNHQELINFTEEIREIAIKYTEKLPAYEMVNRLVIEACRMSLCCAPNELVGVKTLLASVENGINEYEETHS